MTFGALIGLSALLVVLYLNGVFHTASEPVTRLSGMERLEAYSCHKSETKQIITGGVEDYFDTSNIEPSNPSDKIIRYIQGFDEDRTRSDIIKNYDEKLLDKYFADRFDISERTYHGLFIIRLEELSGLKNDGLAIGYNPHPDQPYISNSHGYRISISDLFQSKIWASEDNLYSAQLGDLTIGETSESNKTVLDVIRSRQKTDGEFFVDVADDTRVDFVGFALCLEPEEKKGTVVNTTPAVKPLDTIEFGDNIIALHFARVKGKVCSYGGCLSCEESRPLACISDENLALPEGYDPNFSNIWSGGKIAFTQSVKGAQFSTEDDVDQFCAKEFGNEWRALSRHDGHWAGQISGYGKFPSDFPNVWVNAKNSSHANCWDFRADAKDVND